LSKSAGVLLGNSGNKGGRVSAGGGAALTGAGGGEGDVRGEGGAKAACSSGGGVRVSLRDRAPSSPEFDGPKKMNHEL